MSKLILTSEVTGLGSAGDVVEVKNGYARNYLIPQGFAVQWSTGGEKQIEQIKAARAARELATLEEAQALKAKLEAVAGQADRQGRPRRSSVRFGEDRRHRRRRSRRPASARSTSGPSSSPRRSRAPAVTRRPCACATTSWPRSPSRSSPPSRRNASSSGVPIRGRRYSCVLGKSSVRRRSVHRRRSELPNVQAAL